MLLFSLGVCQDAAARGLLGDRIIQLVRQVLLQSTRLAGRWALWPLVQASFASALAGHWRLARPRTGSVPSLESKATAPKGSFGKALPDEKAPRHQTRHLAPHPLPES